MATFSLEDYQRVLNELTTEIETYGSARGALERTTAALEALAEGSGQLHGRQNLLMNEVSVSTERVTVLALAVDAAAHQSETVLQQLQGVQEGLDRQTENVNSRLTALSDQSGVRVNGLSEEINGLRTAQGEAIERLAANLKAVADQTVEVKASIDANSARTEKLEGTLKQLTSVSFGVLGLLVVVLILLIAGLVY